MGERESVCVFEYVQVSECVVRERERGKCVCLCSLRGSV